MYPWFNINGKICLRIILVCIVVLLLAALLPAERSSSETASGSWWEQEKIRFFWGQWGNFATAGVPLEVIMENLARVGATVFVDRGKWESWPGLQVEYYNADNAHLAHKYGIKYFGIVYVCGLHEFAKRVKAPLAMNKDGKHYAGLYVPCPLYKPLYQAWFLKPVLEAANTGLIDGLHMDWEPYKGRGEADICYCDECFGQFLKKKGLDAAVLKGERYKWLKEVDLVDEHKDNFEQHRMEMFREFARRVHEVKPDLVFSGYDVHDSSIGVGLNTPEVPFFIIDPRHYYEDHTRPWWNSHHAHYRKLGFRHIAGSNDVGLFGGRPESNVSAWQWMYDAAINNDGYWVWFQQEFSPAAWRAFWMANRRIRATEEKVGDFLLHGEQDIHFVTVIEWSGNPELDRKVIQRTYHLGNEHLVHIHNVDTDRPIQIRLRFPRLSHGSRWIATDPIAKLTYVHDADKAVWTAQRLKEGIVVSLENRSELFFHLSSAQHNVALEAAGVISCDEIKPMPDHPKTKAALPGRGAPAGAKRLVYTVTESLGYAGSRGAGWAIGNAIHAINANGENHQRLRQIKGYLWSPVWSPDGTRVAFCHYANGRGQIYVMNADGSEVVNLSNNQYCDKSPVWSPDGSNIAFVSARDEDWEIYVMNSDGSQQKRLTNSAGIDRGPAWSPDGQRIAFESHREGDMDIWMMNAKGTDQRAVTKRPGDQRAPIWSPDGIRIAYVGVGNQIQELLVVDTDGGHVRQIMLMPYIGSICWSPDGQRIASLGSEDLFGSVLVS